MRIKASSWHDLPIKFFYYSSTAARLQGCCNSVFLIWLRMTLYCDYFMHTVQIWVCIGKYGGKYIGIFKNKVV